MDYIAAFIGGPIDGELRAAPQFNGEIACTYLVPVKSAEPDEIEDDLDSDTAPSYCTHKYRLTSLDPVSPCQTKLLYFYQGVTRC
jgi:hypothetical protein